MYVFIQYCVGSIFVKVIRMSCYIDSVGFSLKSYEYLVIFEMGNTGENSMLKRNYRFEFPVIDIMGSTIKLCFETQM